MRARNHLNERRYQETDWVRVMDLWALARRAAAAALVVWGLAGAGPALAQSVRLAQPNAARFPEVTLYAYPTDQRGVMVESLTPDRFQVTENGKPAVVTRVESSGGYLDVCLALDRSPSMLDERKLEFAKLAAHEFVQQLGAQDQAAFITFANGSQLEQALTRDRAPVLAAVDRTEASGNSTTFYDAVYWSVAQVSLKSQGSLLSTGMGRPDARRVVIALTDGLDLSSRIRPEELVSYARANGVTICTVAVGSDADTHEMENLARMTGGMYLRAPQAQDLQRLYATLAEQLRREYRVSYHTPTPAADATRRDVQVGLSGLPGHGNTWYQAPGQGSLLVTMPTPSAPSGPSAVSTGGGGMNVNGSQALMGLLLVLVGVASVVAAFIWWRGNQRETLRMPDSNPRMDLLPLWVREGQTRVGRGEECELVLDSQRVSRVHARIEVASGIVRLIDEGSANGTYVNGRRVRRSQILQKGDVLRFGDQEFRFAGETPAEG